jgi:hypothetical protein
VAAVTLVPEDLTPFAEIDMEKAEAMIADAIAMAAVVAPCILEEDFVYAAAAKAILRGAILRWNDSGSGALTQQGAGPFQVSYDNRQTRRSLFFPSEISQLQDLCAESGNLGAYTIDMLGVSSIHADTCSLRFGANYCSCGADIAGFPIYEVN